MSLTQTVVTLHFQEALVEDTLTDHVHALTHLEKADVEKYSRLTSGTSYEFAYKINSTVHQKTDLSSSQLCEKEDFYNKQAKGFVSYDEGNDLLPQVTHLGLYH